MTEIIKETGIFIIVAEAMVYLAPAEVYAKYVRLIVGMVLIIRLALPVLSLISGEEIQLYQERFFDCDTGKREMEAWQEKKDGDQETYVRLQMEKEIRQRLEREEGMRQIREVKFKEREDGSLYLLITVEKEEGENSLQLQRQYYAEKLQMEISDVEVEVATWGLKKK